MLDELRDLYQEVILDHGKHPRNFREPESVGLSAEGYNPFCGDRLKIFLKVGGDGRIEDVAFQGRGCAISVASASMMTEVLTGKTPEEAETLFDRFHGLCTSDEAGELAEDDEDLERLQVLSGVRDFPIRVKCATLAWHAMKAALHGESETTTE